MPASRSAPSLPRHCSCRGQAALIGSSVDEAALRQAGAAARAAASPITDKRGTAEYRRKVVAVLVRRAGAIARSRVEAQA